MGSCARCTRVFSRRKISISDCISRSKCGGDGGDGRLAFSFEGNGYYESSSVYIDGDLVHFGRSDSQTTLRLHCPNESFPHEVPNESLPREVPRQHREHGSGTFFDKVNEYTLHARQRLQQRLKYGIDVLTLFLMR
mmetsp:Transcript_32568/g.47766  ORF Transcript_32568/g.47766 Transcript_32568/m.47766 type:complete len:136 (+) Transcript_32568:198-605(+)